MRSENRPIGNESASSDTHVEGHRPISSELTDEEIKALLDRAEQRLRQKAEGTSAKILDSESFKLPQLQCGRLPHPTVRVKGQIAHADTSKLVSESAKKLADGVRKVEDPVIIKRRAIEVSPTTFVKHCEDEIL